MLVPANGKKPVLYVSFVLDGKVIADGTLPFGTLIRVERQANPLDLRKRTLVMDTRALTDSELVVASSLPPGRPLIT